MFLAGVENKPLAQGWLIMRLQIQKYLGKVQLQDTDNHKEQHNTINSITCDLITTNTTLLFTQTSQPLLQVQHVPLLHRSGLTVNNSV